MSGEVTNIKNLYDFHNYVARAPIA